MSVAPPKSDSLNSYRKSSHRPSFGQQLNFTSISCFLTPHCIWLNFFNY